MQFLHHANKNDAKKLLARFAARHPIIDDLSILGDVPPLPYRPVASSPLSLIAAKTAFTSHDNSIKYSPLDDVLHVRVAKLPPWFNKQNKIDVKTVKPGNSSPQVGRSHHFSVDANRLPDDVVRLVEEEFATHKVIASGRSSQGLHVTKTQTPPGHPVALAIDEDAYEYLLLVHLGCSRLVEPVDDAICTYTAPSGAPSAPLPHTIVKDVSSEVLIGLEAVSVSARAGTHHLLVYGSYIWITNDS